MKNKFLKILIGILILFVFTNPTQTDFNNEFGRGAGKGRLYFLLFSIWTTEDMGEEVKKYLPPERIHSGEIIHPYKRLGFYYYKKTYLCIFKNFINIKTVKRFEVDKKMDIYSD